MLSQNRTTRGEEGLQRGSAAVVPCYRRMGVVEIAEVLLLHSLQWADG